MLFSLALATVAAVHAAPAVAPVQPEIRPRDAEEARDFQRFPAMMRYLRTMDIGQPKPPPAGNEHLIKSAQTVYEPGQALWDGFFKAAVADKLTNLRALTLISRELKARGATFFGETSGFENAISTNNIDLGLAIPAKNIGVAVWEPDPTNKDPEFLLQLRVVYRERVIHQFPDEIMPATLKIGYEEDVDYYISGSKRRGFLLQTDLYYGPHGVGFRNVKGVGAQKRGFMGFLQKLFFFIPEAVTSMVVDESRGALVVEAFINTVVEEFETKDVYRIRYRSN